MFSFFKRPKVTFYLSGSTTPGKWLVRGNLPVVPRVGETLVLKGVAYYIVVEVQHSLDNEHYGIFVFVKPV